jgi:hypothetical protein
LREWIDEDHFQGAVGALITPTRAYVAVYDPFGSSYHLACVDRPTVKIAWVTKVRASFLFGGLSGLHSQRIEICEQRDRVVVYGVASTGFYVEAFEPVDGKNIFRFSNTFWR